MNIPNLPMQLMAITDSGGANAFFNNDLCQMLITEGNAVADKLRAHFMTSAGGTQLKCECQHCLYLNRMLFKYVSLTLGALLRVISVFLYVFHSIFML